jgi:hypothetical protein
MPAKIVTEPENIYPENIRPVFCFVNSPVTKTEILDSIQQWLLNVLPKKGHQFNLILEPFHHIVLSSLSTGVAIFCDLRKAFDTVDHEILVTKLKKIGIGGVELRRFLNILNATGSPCHELTSRNDLTPLSSGLL